MRLNPLRLACFAAVLAAGPALAQMEPGQAGNPKEVIPEKAPALPKTEPYHGVPQPQNPLRSGRSVGKTLDNSNGVVTPPKNVDPGMSRDAPVPQPHTTPVIPPPTQLEDGTPIIPK